MPNYSNTTVRTSKFQLYDLDMANNYERRVDKPGKVVVMNSTSTYDQKETFEVTRTDTFQSVDTGYAKIIIPAPKVPIVQYHLTNNSVYEDSRNTQLGPVNRGLKCYVTFVHDMSGFFTNTMLNEALARTLSMAPYTTDLSGNCVFDFNSLAEGCIRLF